LAFDCFSQACCAGGKVPKPAGKWLTEN
jgi:hypothetical protein